MAWRTSTPAAALADLDTPAVLGIAMELHHALRDMGERDQHYRETLHLPSLGAMDFSDTDECMQVRRGINKRLRYPWDIWSNGDLWILHKGQDFDVPVLQFQTNIHMHRYNNDLDCTTRKLSEDAIAVQFVKKTVTASV